MKAILGRKVGMTQIFSEAGEMIPVTVIQAGPVAVTQIKTVETDGYYGVQIGFEDKKECRTNKPERGHFAKSGVSAKRVLAEFRPAEDETYELGQVISVADFAEGSKLDVTGTSKGKGFQGVVHRYHFQGVGGKTHGQHNRLRHPGSMGASSWPSRVFPGMRMGGHMGNERVKVFNLKVVKVIPEHNLLVVKGSVPGAKGSYVIIEA